jgi:putative membrane protein
MITHWLISTIAIIISAYLIPGVSTTLLGALVLAVVLGLINMFIKPVLLILTLPINILTLGLFSLVINALLIMFAAKIVDGFAVQGFLPALIFAIVLSLVQFFFKGGKVTS